MADFYQTGVVTTLHRLTPDSIERLESDLEESPGTSPLGWSCRRSTRSSKRLPCNALCSNSGRFATCNVLS